MDTDELFPPQKKAELTFRKLDTLSVQALQEYIGELEAEIERTRAEIKKRGGAKAAVEAFFS